MLRATLFYTRGSMTMPTTMLNVSYDLHVEGDEASIARVLRSIRDECEMLDTIPSEIFEIDDVGKYRRTWWNARSWEKGRIREPSRGRG